MSNVIKTCFLSSILLLFACQSPTPSQAETSLSKKVIAADTSMLQTRQVIDFNFDWQFHLGDVPAAFLTDGLHQGLAWQDIRLPHDWAVDLNYTQENTASSTGFKAAGIGWYQKTFSVSNSDLAQTLWLEFDGIYNNYSIWINGEFVLTRPNGYISFKVDLNEYLKLGENQINIKVDRTAYNDSRWYTGSGIYRDVRLIKTHNNHIAHWGAQITTDEVSVNSANVNIKTVVNISEAVDTTKMLVLHSRLKDKKGRVVVQALDKISASQLGKSSHIVDTKFTVTNPALWSVNSPNLYHAEFALLSIDKTSTDKAKFEPQQSDNNELAAIFANAETLDTHSERFGIRSIEFTANKGFLLNGRVTKIKGVNLHHDAGAVGTAVPKAIWEYRLQKLHSIGVNAIRLSHNPHSSDLLDLADEMGFLVMAESFDDWLRAKDKSVVFLSDNAGSGDSVSSYTEHFSKWAKRDLEDLIKRDFNHPSIIMWSIGNEIEWTYKYYPASQVFEQGKEDYYGPVPPVYDPATVSASFAKHKEPGPDNLVRTARYLSKIVKDMDTSRPVTAGLVIPSVGFVTGYTDTLDVVGFNYRAQDYDAAKTTYPDKALIGSENWGQWSEWKAVLDRDFIPGIFVWTGFAYKGEAGPWPRKGLEISFFAGYKTPRGHQFETFWKETPKVYAATIRHDLSEYKQDATGNWIFTEREHPIKKMQWLRKWEWYGVEDSWNYEQGERVVVHVYANTDESELFLNGKSLGKQRLNDDNNRILLWEVPYEAGELRVVGYNNGQEVAQYYLKTHSAPNTIALNTSTTEIDADHYDVVHVHASILDGNGNRVVASQSDISFSISGAGKLLATDNGWENNVQNARLNTLTTHKGRALALVQSNGEQGDINITATVNGLKSATVTVQAK